MPLTSRLIQTRTVANRVYLWLIKLLDTRYWYVKLNLYTCRLLAHICLRIFCSVSAKIVNFMQFGNYLTIKKVDERKAVSITVKAKLIVCVGSVVVLGDRSFVNMFRFLMGMR